MIYEMISGAFMMCCLISGIFFYKFWKKTGDRLFILFAYSFFLMAVERLVLGYVGVRNEPSPLIYLIRLAAFILIIFAIVDKNRSSSAENT